MPVPRAQTVRLFQVQGRQVAEDEASEKRVDRTAQQKEQTTEQQDVPALLGIAIYEADDRADFDEEGNGLKQGQSS